MLIDLDQRFEGRGSLMVEAEGGDMCWRYCSELTSIHVSDKGVNRA